MFKEIDAYAEAHGLTRSGFLAQAAKREMADKDNPPNVKGYALTA